MTAIRTSEDGITFAVHNVAAAELALPTWKTRDGITRLLAAANECQEDPLQACSGYNSDSVAGVFYHPLLAAVHLAFAQHRPLTLSPDMIWITIVQGLAQHVRNNKETLRHKIVQHQGKMQLCIDRDDLLPGSPENAWESIIAELSTCVRSQVGDKYDRLICNFSTTGPLERTVCEVALLDVFQSYFTYQVKCICGIPSITLEGRPSDWKSLIEKVETLGEYELDWWLKDLRLILRHFEESSRGSVDTSFWQSIYKRTQVYGASIIDGWIVRLIPYVRCGITGEFTQINHMIGKPIKPLDLSPPNKLQDNNPWGDPNNQTEGLHVTSTNLPAGISMVPFTQIDQSGARTAMQFLAGFVAVEQNANTLALRPKLGWAVRVAPQRDQLLGDLADETTIIAPLTDPEIENLIQKLIDSDSFRTQIPDDFIRFYKSCDGIRFPGPAEKTIKFRSLKDVMLVQATALFPPKQPPAPVHQPELNKEYWVRFCDLPDGSYVVMQLSGARRKELDNSRTPWTADNPMNFQEWTIKVADWSAQQVFFRVCHVDPHTSEGRLIAMSIAEFVRELQDCSGQTFGVAALKRAYSQTDLASTKILVH